MTQLQQVAFLCLLSPQRFHHFTLFLLFCFSDLGCLSSHPSSPPVPPPPPVHLLHFFPHFLSSELLLPSVLLHTQISPFLSPRFLLSLFIFFHPASFPFSSFYTLFFHLKFSLLKLLLPSPFPLFPALSLLSASSLFSYFPPSVLFPLLFVIFIPFSSFTSSFVFTSLFHFLPFFYPISSSLLCCLFPLLFFSLSFFLPPFFLPLLFISSAFRLHVLPCFLNSFILFTAFLPGCFLP